jgi:hypothetical protein
MIISLKNKLLMNPDDDIHRILLEISKMIKKVQAGISYKITIIKIKI